MKLREIKFKAWNGEKMLYKNEEQFWMIGDNGYFSLQDHGNENFNNAESINGHRDLDIENSLDNPDLVLLQFTGIKDITGKDIYEGDIIKTIYGVIGKVIWQEENGRFVTEAETSLLSAIMTGGMRNCKVIGNIYENFDIIETLK